MPKSSPKSALLPSTPILKVRVRTPSAPMKDKIVRRKLDFEKKKLLIETRNQLALADQEAVIHMEFIRLNNLIEHFNHDVMATGQIDKFRCFRAAKAEQVTCEAVEHVSTELGYSVLNDSDSLTELIQPK